MVGRASKGASTSQRAHEGARPARGAVAGTEADVFGDDVKMSVIGKRKVWAGGREGEALAHPRAAVSRKGSCCCQMTGKAQLARCCGTQEGCCAVVGH